MNMCRGDRPMNQPITPCVICNSFHCGGELEGHQHKSKEGVGYIRLLVIGNGKTEHCWRCGCVKSGWKNVANEINQHCTNNNCICHTAIFAN